MQEPVISRWLMWIIETVQESKEISDKFKSIPKEQRKKRIFEILFEFIKLGDNVKDLPFLVLDSGDIPEEWENIQSFYPEMIQKAKEELNIIEDEEAEDLVFDWLRVAKDFAKTIEKTVAVAKKNKK